MTVPPNGSGQRTGTEEDADMAKTKAKPNTRPLDGLVRHPFKCPVCEGRGVVEHGFYGGFGATTDASPHSCRTCGGAGVLWSWPEACPLCSGLRKTWDNPSDNSAEW